MKGNCSLFIIDPSAFIISFLWRLCRAGKIATPVERKRSGETRLKRGQKLCRRGRAAMVRTLLKAESVRLRCAGRKKYQRRVK